MITLLLAQAALAAGDPVISVDLPAATVGAGLARLARQADRPLLARPADLGRPRTVRLRGRMPLSQALVAWCTPAGLDCRLIAGGIVVRRAARAAAPARAPTAPAMPAARSGTPDIIVTGRGTGLSRTPLERSYSASHIDAVELARDAPSALAQLLSAMPGVWADTSAGTAANTVRVRGIPLDGYQAVAVEEDGLPVQHDTLPWTDVDQFIRPDLGLASVDYVRGGPSAIFASNAPGGILNLRTRAGGDRAAGALRLTAGDRGLARVEGYTGGPLGGGWRVIASGMAVRDPSVRRIAATLGGGQARLRADRAIAGGGRLTLGLRLLDDDTLNVSSVPMRVRGGRPVALPGFDPRRDSWFGPDLATVRFAAAGERPLARNNRNRLVAATAALDLPVAENMLTLRVRHRRSTTARYAISSSGPPVTANAAIAAARARLAAAYPGTATVALRGATVDGPVGGIAGDALVETVNPVAADTRLRETVAEARYAGHLDAAGRHDLTLGGYATRYHWDFRRAVARVLVEARGGGGLLDLVALDGGGRAVGALTDRGFLSRGSTFEAVAADQRMRALYIADEWALAPQWRIDWGLRDERVVLTGCSDPAIIVDGGDPATLADDMLALPAGPGAPRRVHAGGTAATLAVQWNGGHALSAFARATRAVRLPDAGAFRMAGNEDARTLHVRQAELGLLWRAPIVSLDATLFASRFAQIALEDLSMDPASGRIAVNRHDAAARTTGLELAARLDPAAGLHLAASATVQDSRLQAYRLTTLVAGMPQTLDLSGRRPRRVPSWMAQGSVTAVLPGTPLSLDADVQAMGRRFADDANRLALPGFAIVDLGASWALRRDTVMRLRVTNVFDAIAVMQGDSIGGEVRADAAPVIVARAQQGRIVEGSLTLSF